MNKIEYLEKALERASHNLLCCSQNYAMTDPEEGREGEFEEMKAEVGFLEAWLDEERNRTTVICGKFQDYYLMLRTKYGAKAIELPDPSTVTFAPLAKETT